MTQLLTRPTRLAGVKSNITVDISDMKIAQNREDVIVTYSLGSCVGLTLYDPVAGIGGMIHCMLPLSKIDPEKARIKPYMFVDTGVAARSIALIGDSCGGGLVLTCLLKLRDSGIELPACGISLSGWLDLNDNSDASDLLYHQGYCHQRGRDYAGEANLQDPLISPVFAELHGLPPLLLQAGGVDPTATHAATLLNAAQKAGTVAKLDIAPEMLHGFQGFANLGVPESTDALRRVRSFLDCQIK